jgi:hypothetical protein
MKKQTPDQSYSFGDRLRNDKKGSRLTPIRNLKRGKDNEELAKTRDLPYEFRLKQSIFINDDIPINFNSLING